MPDKEIRLLALDGGGVRGLSALMILEQLMETINPDSPPKPCDYDRRDEHWHCRRACLPIRLVAIMLGRLRMSINDCIDAYLSLSDRVFQKNRHQVTIMDNIQ
jgi:hypothetical protein